MQHFTKISNQVPHNNLTNQTTNLNTTNYSRFPIIQGSLNKLSKEINEMVKTNKLRQCSMGTYKKFTNIQKETCKNLSNTDLDLPPVTSRPYHLPLKHHKFVKEEI